MTYTHQYAAGPPAPTPIEKVTRMPPMKYSAATTISSVLRASQNNVHTKAGCEAFKELPLPVQCLLDVNNYSEAENDETYLFITESILLCVNTQSTRKEKGAKKGRYFSGHSISLRAH